MNMQATLQSTDAVDITRDHGSAFFDPGTLEWQPWVMEGTYYKLLDVDPKTSGFTLLLKVDPGVEAPAHGHLGAVQGYIIEGEFSYDDDQGRAGHVIVEPAGCVHRPKTKDGVLMYATLHGPLTGFNEDGSLAAVVDGKMMLEMARAAGQADHITATFD